MYGLLHVDPKADGYHQNGRIRLGGTALQPSGQWDDFLPTAELQALYMEPSACVTFTTLNAVEVLERKIFGQANNWSDRFLANISGTQVLGNDPHTVAETLRKKGVVFEQDWPYTPDINTWAKYYATIPFDIETQGQVKFRGKYAFGHQWVGTDPTSMKLALQQSPLGVDVDAWPLKDENGLYHRNRPSNHYCLVYGYNPGRYWKVFDTYDHTHKKLTWDYGFSMVKQYTLDKVVLDNSLWAIAIRWLRARMGL